MSLFKDFMNSHVEILKPIDGIKTGINVIDDFLCWNGLPKGDLVLFHSILNIKSMGFLSRILHQEFQIGRQCAWVSFSKHVILPQHERPPVINDTVSHFRVVDHGKKTNELFQQLCDLLSSKRFSVVICAMSEQSMCLQQLRELKQICQTTGTTLIFVSQIKHLQMQPCFPLIIEFQDDFYTIRRATHRPTPLVISENMVNVDLDLNRGYLC